MQGHLRRATDAVLQGWQQTALRLADIENGLADGRHRALAEQANFQREMNDRLSYAGSAAAALTNTQAGISEAVERGLARAGELAEQKVNEAGGRLFNWLQSGIDLLGFVPILGAIPDAINSVVYALRGKMGEAALSVVATVPGFGDAFAGGRKLGKFGALAVEHATEKALFEGASHADDALRLVSHADEVSGAATAAKHGLAPPVKAPGSYVESIIGTAQGPTRTFLPNSFGGRTADEALQLVRRNGIEIGDDVVIRYLADDSFDEIYGKGVYGA